MPGTTSLMTWPDPAHITGAKVVLAGISDDDQLLCFSVALWNGKDRS